MTRTITARQAEEQLGIPRSTFRYWCNTGKLWACHRYADRQDGYPLRRVVELAATRRDRVAPAA